jgi:hypothetical protein
MLWFLGLLAAYILMSISNKLTGNPAAFLGVPLLALPFVLLGGAVLKALGLS